MPLAVAVRPGAKERDVLFDEATGERLMRNLIVGLAAIRAAKAAVLSMTWEPIYCGATDTDNDGRWRECCREDGHPGSHRSAEGPDGSILAWGGDYDDADPGDVLFLPETAAKLLAEPASTWGAVRGKVIRKATILFRDGTSMTASNEHVELVGAINENRARLIRDWAIDWTGDEPVVTNEVRFAGAPEGLEDAAAQDDDEADDPFMRPAPERCGSRPYPAGSEGDDGTECVRPKGHPGEHSDEPIPFDDPYTAAPGGMQDPAPVVRVISDGALPPLCDEFRRGDNGLCATCGRTRYVHERSGFIAADSPVLRGAKLGGGQ